MPRPTSAATPNRRSAGPRSSRRGSFWRRSGRGARGAGEVIGIGSAPSGDANDRSLLVPLVEAGRIVGREPLERARQRHAEARAELPLAALKMSRGEPAIPTVLLDADGDPTTNPYTRRSPQ